MIKKVDLILFFTSIDVYELEKIDNIIQVKVSLFEEVVEIPLDDNIYDVVV